MHSIEKMRLYALLLFCGLLSVGEQDDVLKPGQSGGPSPTLTEDRDVWVYIRVEAPEPWSLSVGDTVKIRCDLMFMKETDVVDIQMKKITSDSVETPLPLESVNGRSFTYTLRSVTPEDRGLYSCYGNTTHSQIKVETLNNKFIWVNDPSPPVSLKLLKANRVKYFSAKTLTIGCEVPKDEPYRIMTANEETGNITECPNQERSGDVISCTIPSLPFPVSKSRQYKPFWCESSDRQKSNILNVTEAELAERNGRDVLSVRFEITPAWFVKEGDSVVFECVVRSDRMKNKDKCDLQLIWTKRNPENNMTVLLSQRASTPIKYTLTNITHEHSGVYSCWDDGTLSNVDVHPWHHFLWVEDDSSPVTIDVLSHNRTMFFEREVITIGCQLPNDQSHWILKRYDEWTGVIKECEKSELSSSRLLSCTMKMGYPLGDYLFWCESTTGIRSNVLNITNTMDWAVLEAPPLPVMEGDDLTMRCLEKNKVTGQISPHPAFFMRTGLYVFGYDGSFTIKNVTKQHEGLYKCRPDRKPDTWETYVTVKARPQE